MKRTKTIYYKITVETYDGKYIARYYMSDYPSNAIAMAMSRQDTCNILDIEKVTKKEYDDAISTPPKNRSDRLAANARKKKTFVSVAQR